MIVYDTTYYKSVAYWPDSVSLGNEENKSTDTHRSLEEAQWVVRDLKLFGFGGGRIIFPLKTEVYKVRKFYEILRK